jgi:hypothetical protein
MIIVAILAILVSTPSVAKMVCSLDPNCEENSIETRPRLMKSARDLEQLETDSRMKAQQRQINDLMESQKKILRRLQNEDQ